LAAAYAGTRPFLSVGYKQIALALASGQAHDLEQLELAIYRATRVFARRQRTWLRDQPIEWLEPGFTKL
jgi:tRNA dimethylallyltransferase